MGENSRKIIFKEIQTTNMVPLIFLDFEMITKSSQLRFWTLSTRKQGQCIYLAFKNLKRSNKNFKSSQEGESKVRIMFSEVTQQEDWYH